MERPSTITLKIFSNFRDNYSAGVLTGSREIEDLLVV